MKQKHQGSVANRINQMDHAEIEESGEQDNDFIVEGARTNFDMRRASDRRDISSACARGWGLDDELMQRAVLAASNALDRAVRMGNPREIRGCIKCITALRSAATREDIAAQVTDGDGQVTVNVQYERKDAPD